MIVRVVTWCCMYVILIIYDVSMLSTSFVRMESDLHTIAWYEKREV